MKHPTAALFACLGFLASAKPTMLAAPQPQLSEVPAVAARPVVLRANVTTDRLPKHELPDGFSLSVAAAAPLVIHPLMACLEEKGRLFVGDAVGVNWNKTQLEAAPPNRVLLLEDTDGDGVFDKSTVFADKLAFPQGAAWLGGSLYVCSPPGLWRLTDTDGDGVADERELLVSGFDYTGNAADVHGPFVHPNGRLYFCHGRKGHRAVGRDGTVVHEGLASGIWSCRPNGTDLQWHTLGCGDNPVEVDFTPDGDVIGVENLYHSQPRGDTLMHWLPGGVYERADQMKAISGLPRTLEHMPVVHNFGHVAVSGCAFWKRTPFSRSTPGSLDFLVTHFNTQRLVRMELTPSGSTYQASENEFLKLLDPDIHLTDVLEDRDGSLLLLDTGGWFRIGCPSSLLAKPELAGAIYRIRSSHPLPEAAPAARAPTFDATKAVDALNGHSAFPRRLALEWVAEQNAAHQVLAPAAHIQQALLNLLGAELDAPSEHALLRALQSLPTSIGPCPNTALAAARWLLGEAVRAPAEPAFLEALEHRLRDFEPAKSPVLANALRRCIPLHPSGAMLAQVTFHRWLEDAPPTQERIQFLVEILSGWAATTDNIRLLTRMLEHASPAVRHGGLLILSSQPIAAPPDPCVQALERMLEAEPGPLLFDALEKLKASGRFDEALGNFANDPRHALALRLRALAATKNTQLTGGTFSLLKDVLTATTASPATRIQAARILGTSPLQPAQQREIAPLFAAVGPVELEALLPVVRKTKDPLIARLIAEHIARNPAIASRQESHYRTAFSDQAPDLFESILHPAYEKAEATQEAKKRQLGPISAKALAAGRAAYGRELFVSGRGTCIACHKVGDLGRAIGPDLTKIGAIRTERDLVEGILFPSNTIARDYEAHVIETKDGRQVLGIVRSHTAEGLLLVDAGGQEMTLAHTSMTADTTLPTSLMPVGLETAFSEQEFIDLVAYLRSLR